jgi:hypothetical protein
MNKKIPTLVGAGIGLAVFLAIALLPSMLYGGRRAPARGRIVGTPVQATLLSRAHTRWCSASSRFPPFAVRGGCGHRVGALRRSREEAGGTGAGVQVIPTLSPRAGSIVIEPAHVVHAAWSHGCVECARCESLDA